MKLLVLGLFCCLALIGCADVEATDTSGNDSDTAAAARTDMVPTQGAPPVPHEVSPDQVGTEFEPDEALVMAQSTPFEAWSPMPGNGIAVHFVTGSPECYGADATVVETPETITITVRTGTLVSAQGKSCIMIAVYGTMELPLTAPVGNREVLNGI